MVDLILHPERTVGLILRGELLADSTSRSDDNSTTIGQHVAYKVPGYTLSRVLRRRLLPKIPERDASLEQDCVLYHEDGPDVTLVALFPLLEPGQGMPYYHPDADALAFRHVPSKDGRTQALLRVDVIPRSSVGHDEGYRLYKACLALLEIIDRHGHGKSTGYKKRVIHDTVVPRDTYQDFYHTMKMRYQHLKEEWVESTDAIKNVFEASVPFSSLMFP